MVQVCSPYIKQEFHNYCTIEIRDKEGKLINSVTSYNTARNDIFAADGSITSVIATGDNFTSGRIELKRPENTSATQDLTTGWYRGNIPTFRKTDNSKDEYIEYEAKAWFVVSQAGAISKITMYSHNDRAVSVITVSDINGRKMEVDFAADSQITLNLHIYFKIIFGNTEIVNPVSQWDNETGKRKLNTYKIAFFDSSFSIFGGSVGNNPELLQVSKNKFVGYLPRVKVPGIAITKSPYPQEFTNSKFSEMVYLAGGIQEYQMLPSDSTNKGMYKNCHAEEGTWKGLIRGIVLPYVGMIELPNLGIFKSKNVKFNTDKLNKPEDVKSQEMVPCYIPKEYIEGGETNNLISITYNGLYNAAIKNVIRYFPATNLKGKTHQKVEQNQAFFSDLDDNYDTRRTRGFSHHVPLTKNIYVGAETLIPCHYSVPSDMSSTYGYLIDYRINIKQFSNPDNLPKGYALNYAVSGEVVTETILSHERGKQTFPYILEYSYDGNTFQTACEFTANDAPYVRVDFPEVTAPIWRIRSSISSAMVGLAGNTTHSDEHISNIAGYATNGYDPLFIFVGNTKKFTYETNLRSPNVMSAKGDFKIKIPYICHENDNFYLSGIVKGETNE